jgi:hypothetical protein
MARSIHSTTAFIIAAFLLFFIALALKTLVGAEMRPEGDETAYAPLESGGGASSQIAPTLRFSALPIVRTQNGLTLGEPITQLRSSRRAIDAGRIASGAELLAVLPRYLPRGATRMLAVYMEGRLAAITTNYRADAAGWEKSLAATTAKYGAAAASEREVKKWTDGQVVLVLKKEDAGVFSITVAFLDSLQKYYSTVSARGAGF